MIAVLVQHDMNEWMEITFNCWIFKLGLGLYSARDWWRAQFIT